MSPSKLSAALQVACAEVLGEPVHQVELTPIYDSDISGPSPQHFHASCDDLRTPSLTLLVNDAQTYAVGGYTTVPWGSRQHAFLPDPHSLLFHLRRSSQGYATFVHPPVDDTASIFCGASFGPVFGRGHDLNAFGNGGRIAPVSAPRSYDIPDNFLGAHTFPRVQVFSVRINPITAATIALPQRHAQHSDSYKAVSGRSHARGQDFIHIAASEERRISGEEAGEVIDLTQDGMDPMQPTAAHSQWVSRWRAICFTAFVAATAWAVMLYTGATTDCSNVLGMLRHIGGSLYAAVSAIFMHPVVASMTAQDLEPAQSTPVQDPVQSKYLIPIMFMLVALLITSAALVLHGLLQMQQRSMCSVQPEPYRHDTQAASDDSAHLAPEPVRAPARSEPAASSHNELASAEIARQAEGNQALGQHAHYLVQQTHPWNQTAPATITAQDADALTEHSLSDSDWEAM